MKRRPAASTRGRPLALRESSTHPREPLHRLTQNALGRARRVLEHDGRRNAKHSVPVAAQPVITNDVMFVLRPSMVLCAVNFDDLQRFVAVKVDDIRSDGALPTEPQVPRTPSSKELPEKNLWK